MRDLIENIWPLVHDSDEPKVLYSSKGEPCVFQKGQRVIPPKQLEFVHSMFNFKDTFYGGGQGGGKSTMLAWCFVIYLWWLAKQGYPGAVGGMFAESMDAVIKRQFEPAREKLYPVWLGDFVGGGGGVKNEFIAKPQFGGWRIQYRTTSNYEDKERSTEYQILGFDESTNITEHAFIHIRGRGRGSRKGKFIPHVPVLCASNPVGMGVGWHLTYFINPWDAEKKTGRKPPSWETVEGKRVWYKGRNFIRSLIGDNPHLGPQDHLTLMDMPERQRAALYEGRWDTFQTQFIMLETKVHSFPEGMRLPEEWPNYLAVDYAFNHTGAAYAAKLGPGLTLWVHAGFEAKGLTPLQFKKKMREVFVNADGTPMKFLRAVADRTMWPGETPIPSKDYPITVLNADDEYGSFRLMKAGNVRNSSIPSWQAVRNMVACEYEPIVDPRTGMRDIRVIKDARLKIRENLSDLWRSFMLLERDEKEPDKARKTHGDYGPGQGDDGPDCVRYIVMDAIEGTSGSYDDVENSQRTRKKRLTVKDAPYV